MLCKTLGGGNVLMHYINTLQTLRSSTAGVSCLAPGTPLRTARLGAGPWGLDRKEN